jgi:hypothetical protein
MAGCLLWGIGGMLAALQVLGEVTLLKQNFISQSISISHLLIYDRAL